MLHAFRTGGYPLGKLLKLAALCDTLQFSEILKISIILFLFSTTRCRLEEHRDAVKVLRRDNIQRAFFSVNAVFGSKNVNKGLNVTIEGICNRTTPNSDRSYLSYAEADQQQCSYIFERFGKYLTASMSATACFSVTSRELSFLGGSRNASGIESFLHHGKLWGLR